MSLQNNVPMPGMNQPPGQRQPQGFAHEQGLPDPETVRRNYREALYELTFNSKPIITNLTIMAQENQHAANAVVREIVQQIKHNAAGQKLPVLYLIDSICKNVGGVYIDHFARDIVSTFLDAYTLTEPSTRRSFERLLQTWKNGMPNGAPVFSRHIIESIERSLNYIRERHQQIHNQQQQNHRPSQPQHPQPQQPQQQRNQPSPQQGRFAPQQAQTNARNQQIHVNPNFVPRRDPRDPRGRNAFSSQEQQQSRSMPAVSKAPPESTPPLGSQSEILSTLQSLLPSQAISNPDDKGASDIARVVSQIQSILPSLPSSQASVIQQYINQILGTNTATSQPPSTAFSMPPASAPAPAPAPGNVGRLSHTPPPVAPFRAPAPAPAPTAAAPINTAELLQGLTSMGILSGAGAFEPPQQSIKATSNGPFRLESKDLQIERPGAVEVLYSGLPLQCKQCGFRYPETPEGQNKMDAHLDSHFRQNRRMKERVKRGLSRSWFVTEEEWISGEGGELTSHQAPAFLNDSTTNEVNMGSPSAGGTTVTVAPETHMVVMPNDEDRKPCPICGERFVDFWNDDEEEWMYKNAVMVNNTIYHATCHADALKSGTLVGSELEDTEMTELTQGVKRKAEEHVDNMDRDDVKAARITEDHQ